MPLADRVVVERPHAGNARASKKDLITLAIRAGEVAGRLVTAISPESAISPGMQPEYIEPATWKGTIDKATTNERTLAKLHPDELALLHTLPHTTLHNVLDAIGIALFCVRR